MAAWQFKLSLVPLSGILACYGKMVSSLPEYKTRSGDEPIRELTEFFNYGHDVDLTAEIFRPLTVLLPEKESWSSDARMFGERGEDEIEIWDDDINCNFDLRKINTELIAKVVKFASLHNCKIVEKDNGTIIEPELELVLAALKSSNAMKFIADPIAYMANKSV